jgi:hypothetical protein
MEQKYFQVASNKRLILKKKPTVKTFALQNFFVQVYGESPQPKKDVT